MPSRDAEPIGAEACSLAERWVLDPTLAQMLVDLDGFFEREVAPSGLRWPGIWILSGWRSQEDQARVGPDNPNSLHTRCPSLAVDLRVGGLHASTTPVEVWAALGNRFKLMGGVWGGDFGGGPGVNTKEMNHFALFSA